MNLLSRLAGRMSGLLVVVAACVGGYLLIHSLPSAGPKASKDASKAAEEEISVTLSPVKARAIRRTVRVVGGLQGQEEVLLSAKVEGRIKRLRHEVGDQVASGEVILEIEDRDYKLLVEEERRALAVDLAKLGIEKPPKAKWNWAAFRWWKGPAGWRKTRGPSTSGSGAWAAPPPARSSRHPRRRRRWRAATSMPPTSTPGRCWPR